MVPIVEGNVFGIVDPSRGEFRGHHKRFKTLFQRKALPKMYGGVCTYSDVEVALFSSCFFYGLGVFT